MSIGATPKESLPLTPEQKQFVSGIGATAQLVAVTLLIAGVLQIVGGIVGFLFGGLTLTVALMVFVQGVLMKVFGLVMLAVASDFKFLGLLPQYGGNHLRNLAKNLTVFCQIQVVFAVLIGLVALGRFLVWWTS